MPSEKKSKICIVCPYPFDTAPGQRFRYEQYLSILADKGFSYTIYSFLSEETNAILYKKGHYLQKAFGVLAGYLRRIALLFKLANYDFVFIFREASPLGPPIFEFLIAKLWRKKIIYDFDDAIWLSDKHTGFSKWIKNTDKVSKIISWSYKISCGNEYLANYARLFNTNAFIIPTTIDTGNYHSELKNQYTKKLIIGWTGTHSTLKYLNPILPIIQSLSQKFNFTFLVICNKEPEFQLPNLEFRPWQKETEIEDLLEINIGIMPLENDLWSQGKCGFKALQYMALGIPAVVSPVGVNTTIVNEGINGFLCDNPAQWEAALSALLQDAELRKTMGIEGRKTIEEDYSVNAISPDFLNLFSR